MFLDLVYKHNQSIERTTIHNTLSDTFVLLLNDEKARRKAGGPLPTQELTVEKHSRTPATSGRIGVLGTRRPLSVAVVPPRPPRPVTGDHQRAAHGVPFGKRRCLGVEETRARRPGERRRPVQVDPAALGQLDRMAAAIAPNAGDGCGCGGGARPKRWWRFTSEHWSGSGARQRRCSAACGGPKGRRRIHTPMEAAAVPGTRGGALSKPILSAQPFALLQASHDGWTGVGLAGREYRRPAHQPCFLFEKYSISPQV